MASVTITNIETGMTLATTFVAYGRYETDAGRFGAVPSVTLITCTIAVGGMTHSGTVTDSGSGDWQADFTMVTPGTRGTLTAHLGIASPPPDAQASDLTVTDLVEVPPFVGIDPPPPPPVPGPSPEPKKDKGASAEKPGGKVALAAHKVKTSFTIGGAYSPGPASIVLISIRKQGKPCGDSKVHRLNPGVKKWSDDVQANVGELGEGYAIIAELQQGAKRKASAALLGVKIEV
jgi:hypothetical protein